MSTTRGSALWVARAVGASTASVAFAAGAHAVGGGAVPAPALLAGLVALGAVAAAPLAGGRLRLVTLVPVLAAVQLVVHVVVQTVTSVAPAGPTGAAHQHAADALALTGAATVPAASHAAHGGPGMLAAHAAAVLLTAALLVGADRAAGHVAAWCAWLGLVLTDVPLVVAPAPRRGPVDAVPTRPTVRRLPAVAPRRGPPAGLAPAC